ncbi:MAG: c-type cytochrome [Planctomycetota bacterium]|nr:c-type cytochrome [Planctomycetota bacterium]
MTANADSGSTGDDFLTFSVPTDVNVWLGHDVRVAPPKWMRVGSADGFVRTDHIVSTNDSKFRLHWKSFESGKVTLGGNTDNGEQGGRSNYIVLIQPKPPTRLANPTTIGDVVPLLAKADAERGRRLFFFSQATRCTNCHHVEGRGQKFAPDLKSIGKGPRRKPAEIVESILKPSAWIVEGFRTQTIVTTKGKTHSGIVLGETGDVVRFVDTNARRFDIKKSDIEERVSKNVSAMPGNVGEFLTPQQVADLVAYLLALPHPDS